MAAFDAPLQQGMTTDDAGLTPVLQRKGGQALAGKHQMDVSSGFKPKEGRRPSAEELDEQRKAEVQELLEKMGRWAALPAAQRLCHIQTIADTVVKVHLHEHLLDSEFFPAVATFLNFTKYPRSALIKPTLKAILPLKDAYYTAGAKQRLRSSQLDAWAYVCMTKSEDRELKELAGLFWAKWGPKLNGIDAEATFLQCQPQPTAQATPPSTVPRHQRCVRIDYEVEHDLEDSLPTLALPSNDLNGNSTPQKLAPRQAGGLTSTRSPNWGPQCRVKTPEPMAMGFTVMPRFGLDSSPAKPPKKVNHLAPIAPIAKKAHSSKRSSGRAMDIDVEGRKSYM